MLVDTHCHIHEPEYPDAEGAYQRAIEAGVSRMICVGTSGASSSQAVEFAASHDAAYAVIGVHPHESSEGWARIAELAAQRETMSKTVAVGEIGLDYFYTHSPRDVQIQTLEAQIQLALDHDLPIVFHVREAFADFWPIFDNFHGIRGELHSFTDNSQQLEAGLSRGLFIGLNGISTFTKDEVQRQLFASIPLEKLLLETDAPFLTPIPFRGTVNEPAFVIRVAEHAALQRGILLEDLARATTANATALFAL